MKKASGYALVFLCAAAWLFPLAVTVCSSLMDPAELKWVYDGGIRVRLAPAFPTWRNYFEALVATPSFLPMYWNSVLVAGSVTAAQAVFSLAAAFALRMCRFRGRGLLRFLYIAVMLMPFQVTLLPNYILIKRLGLYDTFWALILPGVFAPLAVFLLIQFLKSVPEELVEAGLLETSSPVRILKDIVAPAVRPGWIAAMLLVFAEHWNLVEQPLILLKEEWRYPLSLALGMEGRVSLPVLFAGAVVYMAPMLILYRMFEEELLTGLGRARF